MLYAPFAIILQFQHLQRIYPTTLIQYGLPAAI